MCPYPIQILSTALDIAPEKGTHNATTSADSQASNAILQEKEKLTTWFSVVPKLVANEQSLGVFALTWKRYE
jgi:hypothetical protein